MADGLTGSKTANGADMLLKLRNGTRRLRPMAGIMHPWRKLIGDQRPVGHNEKLDTGNTDIAERCQEH